MPVKLHLIMNTFSILLRQNDENNCKENYYFISHYNCLDVKEQ